MDMNNGNETGSEPAYAEGLVHKSYKQNEIVETIYIWNVRRWHLPGRQISKNYNTRYDVDTRKITMQLSKTMNAFYYIPYHILIKAF